MILACKNSVEIQQPGGFIVFGITVNTEVGKFIQVFLRITLNHNKNWNVAKFPKFNERDQNWF